MICTDTQRYDTPPRSVFKPHHGRRNTPHAYKFNYSETSFQLPFGVTELHA